MTTGNKLAKLRREAGYTQEQLAEILEVSRQSISKWESDISYPETEKLIKLGELYNCSMDYLLKDDVDEPNGKSSLPHTSRRSLKDICFEWKSEKTVMGMPLVHINLGLGRVAKGFFAFGLVSKGIISAGMVSMGVISFGIITLGLFAMGSFALGALAAGAIAAGLIAFGGVSLGVIAVGGVAVGLFAVGGAAVGKYLAIGDTAVGDIALGVERHIAGKIGFSPFSSYDLSTASSYLDHIVPWWLGWAKRIIQLFI